MRKTLIVLFFISILFSCNEQDSPKAIEDATQGSKTDTCNQQISPWYDFNFNTTKNNVGTIKYNCNHKKNFLITHTSDAHISPWSDGNNNKFAAYKELNHSVLSNLGEAVKFSNTEEIGIDILLHTGDMLGNSVNTSKDSAIERLKCFMHQFSFNCKIPYYSITGNHDLNSMSKGQEISPEEMHQILAQMLEQEGIHSPLGKNFFYVDHKTESGHTIRIIGLDMAEQDSDFMYYIQEDAYYSQEQINWLCNVALKENLTDLHHIIILNHYPFEEYGPKESSYLCDGHYVNTWSMIPEIVESYRSRGEIHKEFPNMRRKGEFIDVDANFRDTKGIFICYLGGHIHAQVSFDLKDFPNRDNQLTAQHMVLCNNMSPSEKGRIYNLCERIPSSQSSNAFNVYAVDPIMRKVSITYFGAHNPASPIIDTFYY